MKENAQIALVTDTYKVIGFAVAKQLLQL